MFVILSSFIEKKLWSCSFQCHGTTHSNCHLSKISKRRHQIALFHLQPHRARGVKLFAHLALISPSESETAPRGPRSNYATSTLKEPRTAEFNLHRRRWHPNIFPSSLRLTRKRNSALRHKRCVYVARSPACCLRSIRQQPKQIWETCLIPLGANHLRCWHTFRALAQPRLILQRRDTRASVTAAAEPLCNSGVELCCTHYKPDQLLGRRHFMWLRRSHTHRDNRPQTPTLSWMESVAHPLSRVDYDGAADSRWLPTTLECNYLTKRWSAGGARQTPDRAALWGAPPASQYADDQTSAGNGKYEANEKLVRSIPSFMICF